MTHVCVSKGGSIGSGSGSPHIRRLAINWTTRKFKFKFKMRPPPKKKKKKRKKEKDRWRKCDWKCRLKNGNFVLASHRIMYMICTRRVDNCRTWGDGIYNSGLYLIVWYILAFQELMRCYDTIYISYIFYYFLPRFTVSCMKLVMMFLLDDFFLLYSNLFIYQLYSYTVAVIFTLSYMVQYFRVCVSIEWPWQCRCPLVMGTVTEITFKRL